MPPSPDYTLYYWPLPFRGEFVRAALAHVHATWHEAGMNSNGLMDATPAEQLVPHMGPPVLTDQATGFSLAQMPAILSYLGAKHHGLIPDDPALAALTAKLVADANDVLYEMTRHNGAQMWTKKAWKAYQPRLGRWMQIFEETGRRYGLKPNTGFILGTQTTGLADLTAHILWGTMTAKFPSLRPMLETTAPAIAGLSDRVCELPEQAELRTRSDAEYGDEWCSGRIEASLRAVL